MATQLRQAVIIGAGPAGLTAAYELLQRGGWEVTVLEASNAIGGISRTVECNGNRMDIGGHRFFSKDKRIMDFWLDLLPRQGAPAWDDKLLATEKALKPGGPDPEREDRVMLLRRRVSRILYLGRFFDYPISMKFATFRNLGLKRTLVAGFGYLAAALRKRPEKSLKDFMINRFGGPLYRMFFEKYTEKLWGRNPADIDASWGAQRIKGLSLWKCLTNILGNLLPGRKQRETSLIEEFIYPKKGPGQLWETLAERVRALGGTILMNTEACRLECNPDGAISAVIARTPTGETRHPATCVFSSMPVKDLVAAFPEGAVPPTIQSIAAGLPYRDFISVGLEVPRLKLRNTTRLKTVNQIVPDCWIYIQEPQVKLGRLQIFNNWSPYMVRDPQHSIWIGLEYFCTEGDDMWNTPDDDFIAFAIRELKSIGVLDEDAEIRTAKRIRVKKAYPAYFDTYRDFAQLRAWLDAVPNLYCIGRNGQHRYNNMDHSVLTAMEAVRAMTEGLDKDIVWSVNTEKEYHEEK